MSDADLSLAIKGCFLAVAAAMLVLSIFAVADIVRHGGIELSLTPWAATLPLISVLPPHHRRISCRLLSRNHCSCGSSTPFSTASVISADLAGRRLFPVCP